jgi:hypothetical protein
MGWATWHEISSSLLRSIVCPDVVADVSKYKRFVPYCEDSIVLRQPSPQLMMVSNTLPTLHVQPMC